MDAAAPPQPQQLHALAVCPPAEALLRIEAVALALLHNGRIDFAEGDAPVLVNGVLRQTARARSLRVESPTLVKALHFLALMHNVLSMGETCNVREVYYRNKQTSPEGSPTAVANEAQCTRVIKTCGDMCGLTRESLGLCGADKGAFTGCVRWRAASDEAWQSAYGATRTVPGVHADLRLEFEPEPQRRARCVLVVEKHTVRPSSLPSSDQRMKTLTQRHGTAKVFHRIAASDLVARLPCVVVTGRGFPDIATRRFVQALARQLGLPVLGLADCNPFGLAILLVYAHGSVTMGHSYHFAVPELRPLGLFTDDATGALLAVPANAFQAMAASDVAKANALLASPVIAQGRARPELALELRKMLALGKKLELDSAQAALGNVLVDVWLPAAMVRAGCSM